MLGLLWSAALGGIALAGKWKEDAANDQSRRDARCIGEDEYIDNKGKIRDVRTNDEIIYLPIEIGVIKKINVTRGTYEIIDKRSHIDYFKRDTVREIWGSKNQFEALRKRGIKNSQFHWSSDMYEDLITGRLYEVYDVVYTHIFDKSFQDVINKEFPNKDKRDCCEYYRDVITKKLIRKTDDQIKYELKYGIKENSIHKGNRFIELYNAEVK